MAEDNKKGTVVEDGEFKEVNGTEKKETKQKVKKPIDVRIREFADEHPRVTSVACATVKVLGFVSKTALATFVAVEVVDAVGGFKATITAGTEKEDKPDDIFDIPFQAALPENPPVEMPTVEEPEKEYADEVIPE